jgi:hypothetical protein
VKLLTSQLCELAEPFAVSPPAIIPKLIEIASPTPCASAEVGWVTPAQLSFTQTDADGTL